MKKKISLLLSVVLVVTSMFVANVTVFAATSGSCGTKATWNWNESASTLTISGTGATDNYSMTSLIGNKKAPWESYKPKIKKIIVDKGITEIGRYNFYNCVAVTSVSLPTTLTKICGLGSETASYGAFQKCTALTSITLPASLTSIEACAFKDCTALKNIVIPDAVTSLGYCAFADCTALTSVTFGKGLTSTGINSFRQSGIKTINWSDSITTIDEYSFYGTGLTSVTLPQNVTSVGLRSFADCFFLNKVTVENTNCTFSGDPFNGSNQTITIYGHKSSTAETFATDNKYAFKSTDSCDHEKTHQVVVKEPTCEEDGETDLVCDDCGQVVSVVTVKALGHEWVKGEVHDDTDINGHIFTDYKCSRCGATKQEVEHVKNTDPDAKTTYKWVEGNYDYVNTATCDKTGYEKYTCTCPNCKVTETHVVPKGNHKVDNWTVTKAATCTEDGEETGVCTLCGAKITQTIKATGHEYTNLIKTEDKTEEDGHIYKIYKCPKCNQEVAQIEHTAWVTGHYTPKVISEAHCVIDGLESDTCDICGKTRTVTIPANGQHEWEETSRTDPTCTAKGKIYYKCKNCSMTKSEDIPALGHDYQVDYDHSKDPNCTESGYKTYKCSRCSASKQETIPAAGHIPINSTVEEIKESTCTEDGLASATCAVCGKYYEYVLEKTGHKYENVVKNLTDEGKPGHYLITPTCIYCGATDKSYVSHEEWLDEYTQTELALKPTCVTKGYYKDTCTICNEIRRRDIPATGHMYVYYGTNSSNQLKYRCSKCSMLTTQPIKDVYALWNETVINQEPTTTAQKYSTCYIDFDGNGIINAKDFAQLTTLRRNIKDDETVDTGDSGDTGTTTPTIPSITVPTIPSLPTHSEQ